MALLERKNLAGSSIAAPAGIDHELLAHEYRVSNGKHRYADATKAIITLLLDDEPFGEARVTNDQRGDQRYGYPVTSAIIESLDLNPARYALGLLVAARSTIVYHPRLIAVEGRDLEMVLAAQDVAPYFHGWRYEETESDGRVGFSFNRLDPDPAVPQWATIGKRPDL